MGLASRYVTAILRQATPPWALMSATTASDILRWSSGEASPTAPFPMAPARLMSTAATLIWVAETPISPAAEQDPALAPGACGPAAAAAGPVPPAFAPGSAAPPGVTAPGAAAPPGKAAAAGPVPPPAAAWLVVPVAGAAAACWPPACVCSADVSSGDDAGKSDQAVRPTTTRTEVAARLRSGLELV